MSPPSEYQLSKIQKYHRPHPPSRLSPLWMTFLIKMELIQKTLHLRLKKKKKEQKFIVESHGEIG